jgi:ATP-binding cassette subfamily F protein uup
MQTREFKPAQGKVDISTPGRRIGKKVIELTNICQAYGGRTLIKDFTYNFNPEDRIGIIGSNGAGKSTLMNIITGRIQPDAGSVEIGTTIQIGYFDQHSEELLSALNQEQRVIDYIKEVGEFVKIADGTQISASQMLERFLFPGNQQYAPIDKLSGGEKRRLFLLRLLMSAPNVLILDEPTNDLDVQTLAVLEDYLEDFNGCMIAVSHDRYFLDRTVDKIFAFEPGGILRQYPGNYSVYLDFKKKQAAEAPQPSIRSQGNQREAQLKVEEPMPKLSQKSKPRKLSYKEKREFERLETQIPQMETEKAEIEKTLYKNPPTGYTQVQNLSVRLAELNQAIATATDRWLELAEVE